jgi:hypothetical protein
MRSEEESPDQGSALREPQGAKNAEDNQRVRPVHEQRENVVS